MHFDHEISNRIWTEAVEHSGEEGFVAESYFIHHEDIEVSKLATEMSTDRYQLIAEEKPASEMQYMDEAQLATEAQEALRNHTIHLLMDFRMDYVEQHLKDLMQQIGQVSNDPKRLQELVAEYKDMQQIRNALAKKLGSHIIV